MSKPNDDRSVDNRSWLEICDEELQAEVKQETLVKSEPDHVDETVEPESNEIVESEPDDLDESKEEGEITHDSINLSTVKEETNDQEFPSSAAISNILSYAKVLSQGAKVENKQKRRTAVDISTDDLSLTSHLDIFHVDSPCKEIKKEETEIDIMLDEDTVMFSPVKNEENVAKNMKRPFKLIDSPLQNKRERTNSVHSTHKVAKSDEYSDVHSSQNNDADKNSTSPGSKRELEVNPDILCRKQKQIDYGKNTVGYERYCQLVPKHKRTKEQPKTPPKHLKMSRRAWDGLVKNWRLKLHKWDPAGDNDDFDLDSVNFDQYSLSSDVSSSYDSSSVKSDSTPSTPQSSSVKTEEGSEWSKDRNNKSDKSKELWPNCPQKSEKSDDEEYLGCESLNENCVKACS